MNHSAVPVLGKVGMPAPLADLARRRWDAIIVGGGHNGLTCAFYLARAGRRVLVLESRERIGGACTLEETWPGYRVSPCAYVVGLLHHRVIEELRLPARGYEWTPAMGGYFVPFEDGSSIQLWDDEAKAEAELRAFSPRDVRGRHAMHGLMKKIVYALRPMDDGDTWLHRAPSRAEIEARLGHDPDAIGLLFEWSMAELMDRFLVDERMKMAYMGQGVVGSAASPFDPGTASLYYHHFCGRLDGGEPGGWGYVKGGMGMVSFLIHDAAVEAGATVAAGVPVARILPGEGVELAGGERIQAPVVVSNADPVATLRLLGAAADAGWQARVEAVPMKSATVKFNAALRELPDFTARPGIRMPHHLATINTPITREEWRTGHAAAMAGRLPARVWTEIYLQTAYDPTVAPPGQHLMSVFSQYVPHTFAQGTWDDHRQAAGEVVLGSIARFCSNLPDAVIASETLGPPDVESRLGLTGGQIFQGECLPQYMWQGRLTYRTPMPGVYLCGAGTWPGGSVIGINGRNTAYEVLGLLD
ncbi:MAG: NAD(P)/FAD-dependent oxidoreductase [Gemmatimonadales bacterium]|jgi:phytoene dehydrogenase-like protein|nr:NAD(P)/FAD-dependent oxidoreductase [Gemmatimonadales bacterium]